MKIDLKDKPKHTRFGRATTLAEAPPNVQSEGGMYGAGMISNVSLTTQGEALGHYAWLDSVFMEQLSAAMKAAGDKGIKSRFTHPGMSSDGLGRMLGRINNAKLEGTQLIGDLHFAKSAQSTPDGNLVEYVSMLVEEDSQAAGLSIVFDENFDAEISFLVDNGAEIVSSPEGDYLDMTNFKSPDPANVNNYYHVRLAELRAADLVDEPAANPNGMFDSMPIARNIDQALAFALGLDDTKPDNAELFGVDVDRASAFVGRFLSSRGLSIVTKPTESQKPQAEGTIDLAAERLKIREQLAAEQSKFTTKFGAENGVKWFNEGKTYEQGLELHCEVLSAREKAANDKAVELQGRLDSLKLGEVKPVDTGSQADADADAKNKKVPFAQATGATELIK